MAGKLAEIFNSEQSGGRTTSAPDIGWVSNQVVTDTRLFPIAVLLSLIVMAVYGAADIDEVKNFVIGSKVEHHV